MSPFAEIRSIVKLPYSAPADELIKKAGIKHHSYGHRARMFYLAYAFVRGVPYRVTEPTARPLFDSMGHIHVEFTKGVALLATAMTQMIPTPLWDRLKVVLGIGKEPPTVTPEAIRAWMAQSEPETHKTRRLAKEAAARQAREARRAAFAKTTQRVA